MGSMRENHPAGAEAHIDSIAFAARLKSCPVTKQILETQFMLLLLKHDSRYFFSSVTCSPFHPG